MVVDSDEKGAGRDYVVPALQRGLAILGLLGRERPSIRLSEISRILGLPRATAFRLVHTLEREGYLERSKHGATYSLGPRVLTLGFDYLHSQEMIDIAGPMLDDLRDRTGASTHMGVLDRQDVLYIYRAASHHRLSSNRRVGSRQPAHVNSMGRCMLFDHSEEDLDDMYLGYPMEVDTHFGPKNLAELKKCLALERERGYVAGSFVPGVAHVAAPLRDQTGAIVAAVNVSDYESLPCMEDLHSGLKNQVLATAAEISRRFGYSGHARMMASPPARLQPGSR